MTPLKSSCLTAGLFAIGVIAAAHSQTPPPQGKSMAASAGIFAYPTKGQNPEQQAKDESECYAWSKQQTGYDPMSPPPVASAAPPAEAEKSAATGARAKGAVRGAAAGAVITIFGMTRVFVPEDLVTNGSRWPPKSRPRQA
jgi:hypothetical protein